MTSHYEVRILATLGKGELLKLEMYALFFKFPADAKFL